MILGIIIGIMILAIVWLLYANEIGRMKMNLIKDEYLKIRGIIGKFDEDWEKDIAELKNRLDIVDSAVFVSVKSADMMRFEERVPISHILSELMKDLGYDVEKGTLAVCKIEKKRKSPKIKTVVK